MFLLSILPGHPGLAWGCTETGRRCSRWLLTGPPMAHLGREGMTQLDFLLEIHLLDGLFLSHQDVRALQLLFLFIWHNYE